MIKNPNVRPETIKFPEKGKDGKFSDTGHGNIFLDTSPEARKTKAKVNYWDHIKRKSFCTVKETINKTKRQPMEWEKIFANRMSMKGLVSKIH